MAHGGHKANKALHRSIHKALTWWPGMKKGEIAKVLGISWRQVDSALLSMENNGMLLSEDDDGRLYPFG